jgi:hypothetical protein
VNCLYAAYVDKDTPIEPLPNQRFQSSLRQSFTTPGIYGSRQGQFVIQNSFSALGNGLLGLEPRYDRFRCSGFWKQTRHAVVWNFVAYNRTEKDLRPLIASYAGAFGARVVAGTWKPGIRS